MSLLLLLDGGCPGEEADPAGTALGSFLGMLRSLLDGVFKQDDLIGGRAVTRLTQSLSASELGCMYVESTIGFGELTDGQATSRVLVGGEVIEGIQRNNAVPFLFEGLTRGVSNTEAKTHPAGSLVYDLSRNTSAIDRVRRGLLVDYAVDEDLQVIQRNLGLKRCPGIDDETLRAVIKAVAYLPKQTLHAFRKALDALLGSGNYTITERTSTDPYTVYVGVRSSTTTDIRGRFLLNGGERQETTGALAVITDYPIDSVQGVYDDTESARRGRREGLTNYFTSGSFAGQEITLGSSPGAAGTPVIIDYTSFNAHYLAADETVRQDFDQEDRWAYLADPLLATRCLLDQIRAAGVRVEVFTLLES